MSDWMQVTKETWVPWDLQDLLEAQEDQEDLALLDLKVFTKAHSPYLLHKALKQMH